MRGPCLLIQYAFLLSLASGSACAAARSGEVVVREGNQGVPCFSISEAQERRTGAPNFHSITVSEAGAGAKGVVWIMKMPKHRTFPVSFRMCVPYAGRLPVLPQTPARGLQPGRVYEVLIEPRPPFAGKAPRSYRGRFCVVKTAQGRAGVDLPAPDSKGRHVCAG